MTVNQDICHEGWRANDIPVEQVAHIISAQICLDIVATTPLHMSNSN